MAWKGESRRHSLARKGVSTAHGLNPDLERISQNYEERLQAIQEFLDNPTTEDPETNYYNYLELLMGLPYTRRILDKTASAKEQFSFKEMGKTIELYDLHFYDKQLPLQKLNYDEYIEMINLMASEPRITRDIHMKLAKKGWVSLYDGYYDAVIPSYRAYRQLKEYDLQDYVWDEEKRWLQ